MVRSLQQMFHLSVRIDHVVLSVIYFLTKFSNLGVLCDERGMDILGNVLCRLNNPNNFIKLLVLVFNLLLLKAPPYLEDASPTLLAASSIYLSKLILA